MCIAQHSRLSGLQIWRSVKECTCRRKLGGLVYKGYKGQVLLWHSWEIKLGKSQATFTEVIEKSLQ